MVWVYKFFLFLCGCFFSISAVQAQTDFNEHFACLQNVEQEYSQAAEQLFYAYETVRIIPLEFQNQRQGLWEERLKGIADCESFLKIDIRTPLQDNFLETLPARTPTRGIASLPNATSEGANSQRTWAEEPEIEESDEFTPTYDTHRVFVGY